MARAQPGAPAGPARGLQQGRALQAVAGHGGHGGFFWSAGVLGDDDGGALTPPPVTHEMTGKAVLDGSAGSSGVPLDCHGALGVAPGGGVHAWVSGLTGQLDGLGSIPRASTSLRGLSLQRTGPQVAFPIRVSQESLATWPGAGALLGTVGSFGDAGSSLPPAALSPMLAGLSFAGLSVGARDGQGATRHTPGWVPVGWRGAGEAFVTGDVAETGPGQSLQSHSDSGLSP